MSVAQDDTRGLRRLLRYGARPPLVAAEQDPADDPLACRPLRRDPITEVQATEPDATLAEAAAPPPHVRIAWSELLRRSFGDPLVCPRCQGPMRLIAVIKDPQVIKAILNHPAHRDDDIHSGLDPPQLHLDPQSQREAFQPG